MSEENKKIQDIKGKVLKAQQKRPRNIGQWVAIACVVFVLIVGTGLASFGLPRVRQGLQHAQTSLSHLGSKVTNIDGIKGEVKNSVTSAVQGQVGNTVSNTVHGAVNSAVNSAVSELAPNTDLSTNGIGNKTIQNVKIKGKAVLITGILAAPANTEAKLELSESNSARLIASMSFGTAQGQTTATIARLFTVIPGDYTVRIETTGAWNVTIVEK